MTEQELDILPQDSSRELIERHIGVDPARAALRLGPHAALLSTQIKYLQRAKTKLPSYHRARCIIPPLAFEQASSEAAAEAKTYEGGLCIDLTCGLGVDSLMLSRRFPRTRVSDRRDRAVSSQGLENSVQNARHRTAEPAEKGFSARCRANRPGDRHPAGRQRHGGFHDGERATDRRHTIGRRTRKGQATLRTIHYICRTIDTQ